MLILLYSLAVLSLSRPATCLGFTTGFRLLSVLFSQAVRSLSRHSLSQSRRSLGISPPPLLVSFKFTFWSFYVVIELFNYIIVWSRKFIEVWLVYFFWNIEKLFEDWSLFFEVCNVWKNYYAHLVYWKSPILSCKVCKVTNIVLVLLFTLLLSLLYFLMSKRNLLNCTKCSNDHIS